MNDDDVNVMESGGVYRDQYNEKESIAYRSGNYATSDYYPMNGYDAPETTPVETKSVAMSHTNDMASGYADERDGLQVYWDGVEHDEVITATAFEEKFQRKDLATPAYIIERESWLAKYSGPRVWESPELGEHATGMKPVVTGNGNVSETGSKPSIAVETYTTMATRIGVGMVSECDTERDVEAVAVVVRARENLVSEEERLRNDYTDINCDGPELI
ncbi:hypothetical protein PC119_g10111 [Phytophthora cactorum]|uniref:Uncharacterized protein n=2 Tax=Phytophthora cactorum TaxID=29920 RepID=A0A8T0ZQ20_9STRA|nr:hypothetical protein PC113_g4870 [Phytophthora cactorum]KAG2897512.1 hypothetical protein PC114_g14646 [Phytophthora cactorum]KAG2928476.1 hypothetical protein PC117_g14308 [Phytophthora cactorum]KAG3020068.1 hypothetical protein PC119_g10111 [Phytophthora cactorum]